MAILETLLELDWKVLFGLFVSAVVIGHLVVYISDPHGLRSFPGPTLAKLSDLWLARVAANGHRSEDVHELHKKYGEFSFFSRSSIEILAVSPCLFTF